MIVTTAIHTPRSKIIIIQNTPYYIVYIGIPESKHRMPRWTTSPGLLTRTISGLLGMALASCVLQKSSVCLLTLWDLCFPRCPCDFSTATYDKLKCRVKIAIQEPPFKHNSRRYFWPGSWSHIPMQPWASLAPRQSLPGSRPACIEFLGNIMFMVHGCPSNPSNRNQKWQKPTCCSTSFKHSKIFKVHS